MRRWRWVGFAGSVLVAAAAYVIGANVGPAPAGSVALSTRPGHLVALAGWLAGAAALVAAWLRVARRSGSTGGHDTDAGPEAGLPARPSTRWLLVTGALWALPLLVAPPLGSRDVFAYACQGAAFAHGFDPYTAGAQASSCRFITAVPAIWRTAPAPYGPLWLALSGVAARVAGTNLWVAVIALRVLALAGLALAGWCLSRLARACRERGDEAPVGRALWLGLLSPLVLVHGVSGAHNDAVATGLVLAGLALAVTGRAASAARWYLLAAACGAVFALALAVKVVTVVAAPFALGLLLPRPTRPPPDRNFNELAPSGAPPDRNFNELARSETTPDRNFNEVVRGAGRAAVPFLGAAVACYAILWAATGLGFGWLAGLRPTTSMVQWTSPPTGLGMAVGYLLRVLGVDNGYATAVAIARVLGALALAGSLAVLWWRAVHTTGTAAALRLTGVALAASVLLGPVFYPWYALTPLAVLACCVSSARVRGGLATATAVLVFLVLPDGYGLAVATKLPGALAVAVAACAAVIWVLRRRTARL